MEPEAVIRVQGPWPTGFNLLWRQDWNPLQVLIDDSVSGLLRPREVRVFSVSPGQHTVQVRYARRQFIRSKPIIVEVHSNESVNVACPFWRLPTVGFPKLRVATERDLSRVSR